MCAHPRLLTSLSLVVVLIAGACSKQPHIVLAIADDLGWNDIGYNNPLFQTPTLDKLARTGIILKNHYSQSRCSPSRASLLTGRYPSHIGAGLTVGNFGILQDNGLPTSEVLLSEKLRKLGYYTALIGKWHLGMSRNKYLPTRRGFDYFFGYYGGHIDYWDHGYNGDAKCPRRSTSGDIVDLHKNEKVVRNSQGNYSTTMFSNDAEQLIKKHNESQPLFLVISFPNNHHPLQAPTKYIKRFLNTISDNTRRVFAAKSLAMDDAIDNITRSLKSKSMWNDTVFVFLSDNGGIPIHGGNNWPLRGAKGTLYEGGIKTVCFLHYKKLRKTGFKSRLLSHVSDWYPTLLALAGGKQSKDDPKLDGYNIWKSLTRNKIDKSPRTEVLLNMGNSKGIRVGAWKLLFHEYNVTWFPPPEKKGYSAYNSDTPTWPEQKNGRIPISLFNIDDDPHEKYNLHCAHPTIVRSLLHRLKGYLNSVSSYKMTNRCERPALKSAEKIKAWGPWAQNRARTPWPGERINFGKEKINGAINKLNDIRRLFQDCKSKTDLGNEEVVGSGESDGAFDFICDNKSICGAL